MAADPRLARMATASETSESSSTTSTPAPPPPPPPPPPPDDDYDVQKTAEEVAAAAPAEGKPVSENKPLRLKVAVICAANQNRSMEAHYRLASSSYPVISFGTGSLVRLPGPSITQPNVYNFNSISYEEIYEELKSKDRRLYTSNGVLEMLQRNKLVKHHPERFQDWTPGMPRLQQVARGDKGSVGTEGGIVDAIITCEERCWDAVVDDLMSRGAPLNRPVHVFN
ncbi:RNA polymerase II subunit A C-terminal domain phosphatase, partial [Ascosphaera aggregata]